MKNERDFTQIPAAACTLVVGEFEIGDNGDGAKSAPVKLVARSGKAIEHWFWGRVVHDLAGMHLHKSRIPIDYVHDSKEVIGYLNRFDTESGDLVTSGALVPFKDSDRATEIIHKSKAGVPYEASINFGGDGIKIEDVLEGHMSEVNGQRFDGPGIIVREWPLRGVAICPYGADANTESKVLSGNEKVFSAAVLSAPETATKEPAAMKKVSVEVAAKVEDAKAAEVKLEAKPEAVEVKPVEAQATEAAQAVVEVPAVEAAPAKVEAVKPEAKAEEKPQLSRDEFAKIAQEFGNDIAVKTALEGGDYGTALKAAYDALKAEVAQLRATVAAGNGGTPAKVVAAPKNEGKLFKTGK